MSVRNAMIAAALLLSTTACASANGTGDSPADAAAGAAAEATGNAAATGAERERTAAFNRDELVNTGGWTLQSATAADGAGIAEVRVAGAEFDMTFSGNGVSAQGGCNQLSGTYTASGKRLEMTLNIATRMSCSDDKNLADRRFSELMSQSFKVELLQPQPYRMRLTSDSGDVLVFQAKPIPL
ncbi:MAG: META domain-containing protein [Pseudomonadota bacterium]|jgi:heat shock protein HslJ